jgi:hypothetical protein
MPYTDGSYLVKAVMEAASGLPADRIVNDFCFEYGVSSGITDYNQMIDLVDEFYNFVHDITPLSSFISRQVNRSATHNIQIYVIGAGGDTGSPVWEEPWLGPADPGTASGLPTEVAGVLSYHADLSGVLEEVGDTRPKARRRGRLYVGPLVRGACVDAPPYLLNHATSGSFGHTLRAAAVKLMDDSTANAGPWSVWSRADSILRPVVGGWTDDAPDTQRRRGTEAAARVVWG